MFESIDIFPYTENLPQATTSNKQISQVTDTDKQNLKVKPSIEFSKNIIILRTYSADLKLLCLLWKPTCASAHHQL